MSMAALPRVEPYLPPGEAPATPPAYRLWGAWCQGSVDGAHRVQRVGPIRGSDPLGMDCDQPVRLVCRACPAVTSARCGQYSVAACRPCSRRHQRLVLRSVAGPLLDLLGSVRGARGWLLTVGPPGERPHRRLDARLDGRWLHSGERTACSCHLWLDDGMGAWNARSGRVWNRFMTALKREYPGLEYWDGVEPQDGKRRADGEGRMGLHRHAALALPAGVQVDPFVVQRLALRAGYGCSVDVEEIRSADVAAYVAKRVASYVVKGVDDRGRVPWDVQDPQTGALTARRATYRRYSQSRGWGPSAAAISRAQKDAHRARVARARVAPTDDDLADLDGVCLDLFARPPPVALDPDALPAALLGVWRSSRGLVARLPRTAPLLISGN